MPPQDVLHLLPAKAAPALRQSFAELAPVHIACLDLGLKTLPSPQYPIVFDLDQPRFLTAQSEFAQLAPTGSAVVHSLLQLDPRQPENPAAERAALESLMDEVHPTWRSRVVEQRFLPRMLASAGLPLATSGGMAGRPSSRCVELDNVYLAGDWVGPEGYLADAALASARAAAHLLLAFHFERVDLAA
jgi:phytoene dehydrogenase-like protein